jgi:hypothetical protein
MSFLPITIPEGNLFYHGTHRTTRPSGLEWLAFEMEHANMFAMSFEFHKNDTSAISRIDAHPTAADWVSLHGKMSRLTSEPAQSGERHGGEAQAVFSSGGQRDAVGHDDGDDHHKKPCHRCFPPDQRGYFHTYRAARPLNLVYIDGMAAAKCPLGSLDSQDFILNDWDTRQPPGGMGGDEIRRARSLCDLAKEWDVDGWIRMEAGFEIIYCDFREGAGLDLVSVHGSPWRNETGSSQAPVGGDWIRLGAFEWMRAAAERYHGHAQGRLQVDFSGMVSAFAYDVNLTNFDETRPELPRIVNSTREERQGIKARLGEVLKERNGRAESSVNWQRVVDDIVSRYSHRLWILAQANLTADEVRSELATLTYPFLSFPDDALVDDFSSPLARCADHSLSSVTDSREQWTPEDHAIHAAARTVSHLVCQALFEMRRTIHTSTDASDQEPAVRRTQTIARNLRARLDWTTWKECGRCEDPLALCFVAMFPIGGAEDHFSPRCKLPDDMAMGYFVGRTGHSSPPEKPPKDGERRTEDL